MSKIYFLANKLKNLENVNTRKIFSRTSISHSHQNWKYLVQRILNNELDNELKILQLNLDSNIFQRYQHQLTNEYKIEEIERIYKVHILPLLWLPSRETIRSISIRVGSILYYSTINTHMAHILIIPSIVKFDIIMKLSEIEDQIEREQNKLFTQKRVTIISPNNTLDKQISFIKDNSLILTSPKWHSSIDERHISSLDLRSFNQRSSDDLRQMIIKSRHTNSSQDIQKHDEPLSSLNNFFFRKHHQNSVIDIHHDNNLSRLSLHSISYGFDLGTKMHERKKIQHDNIISSSNYRLPANKIELDINQQEIIRRTGSFKRKSDII